MTEETIAYLRQVIPFRDLPDESFRAIARDVTHVEIPQGQVIIREGEEGDSLYIIKSGSVQVFINGPEQDEKIILSKLSDADYFGEMSLITGEPRSASIETLTNVSLLRLDKEGFQRLISENPKITLYLSHMLSQRLKQANIKRAETEKFYHAKITQTGTLAEIPFYEVLRFCEQNALTGKVKIEHENERAEITFLKGNVQTVELGNLSEDQVMDTLMQWNEGAFTIEPSFFSPDEPITTDIDKEAAGISDDGKLKEPAYEKKSEPDIETGKKAERTRELKAEVGKAKDKNDISAKDSPPLSTLDIVGQLLNETFRQLVSIVGSQHLRECIVASQEQLIPFFPALESLKFTYMPDVKVKLAFEGSWNDKRTLAVAVFLQSVLQRCSSLVIGMRYFDVREAAGSHAAELDKIAFFEYMSHADELAQAR
jgi:CRP-like cAMP-binding protein